MVRTSLGLRLAGLSIVAAMLAFAGWAYSRTMADPDTSAELARRMLEQPAVADKLVAGATPMILALQMRGVDTETATGIAHDTLADPRVVEAAAGTVAGMHHDLISGTPDAKIELPSRVLTAAARDAAVARGVDPNLIGKVPSARVPLPSTEAVASVGRLAGRWGDAAAIAGLTFALAVVIASEPWRVVLRVGRRATLFAGGSLVIAALGAQLAESATSLPLVAVGTVTDLWLGAVGPVLLTVLACGLALWLVSSYGMDGRLAARVASMRTRTSMRVHANPAEVDPVAAGRGRSSRRFERATASG